MTQDKLSSAFEHLDANEFETAERLLKDVVSEEGDSTGAFLAECALAQIYLAQGKPKKVLDCMLLAEEVPSRDEAMIAMFRGCALVDLGKTTAGLDAFLAALLAGGTEAFAAVDDRYVRLALEKIRPPAEYDSWHDYKPDADCEEDDDAGSAR